MFYVYILKSLKDSTFYTGQSKDLQNRIKKHNSGQIKSTKSKAPYIIVYFEEFKTRAEAMHREWEIKKKYNSDRKRRLILNFDQNNIQKISGL